MRIPQPAREAPPAQNGMHKTAEDEESRQHESENNPQDGHRPSRSVGKLLTLRYPVFCHNTDRSIAAIEVRPVSAMAASNSVRRMSITFRTPSAPATPPSP